MKFEDHLAVLQVEQTQRSIVVASDDRSDLRSNVSNGTGRTRRVGRRSDGIVPRRQAGHFLKRFMASDDDADADEIHSPIRSHQNGESHFDPRVERSEWSHRDCW